MLVLTRKLNEKIMIGDDIEIIVVNVGEEKVQLGINAPRSIPVHRREVYDEIVRENLLASRSRVPSLDALCGLGLSARNGAAARRRAIEGPARHGDAARAAGASGEKRRSGR
jgi:carbon storage regulator